MAVAELRKIVGIALASRLEDYPLRIRASRLDQKIIRDPIFGFQRFFPHETLVIDSPLFQRLRGIFQTALAYLTYPSAIHTRFEHSLNCAHLAGRVIDALQQRQLIHIHDIDRCEVRMAALLHDIGHSVFSHASESHYENLPEVRRAKNDPEVRGSRPSAGEVINYCIVTSDEFTKHLWEPIRESMLKLAESGSDAERPYADAVRRIDLRKVGQMIIGASPGGDAQLHYLADIVNGPIDVDKLDYLSRDSYFTGVGSGVDIDRLLASVRVADVSAKRDGSDRRLAVDHKGIAVVEQMLFARMILYDTVYHHHKVRAATHNLTSLLGRHGTASGWPTASGTMTTMTDFLEIDEYDFFGHRYSENQAVADAVQRLRQRDLPVRALVLMPRTCANGASYERVGGFWGDYWLRHKEPRAAESAQRFLKAVVESTCKYARDAGATDLSMQDVIIDVPDPPGLSNIGAETYVVLAGGTPGNDYAVPLADLFPFHKVTANYAKQYKYRTYVFAPERYAREVSYGAFRAFADQGVALNDLSLILAHQAGRGQAFDLLLKDGIEPPGWRDAYVPDRHTVSCKACLAQIEWQWKFCAACGAGVEAPPPQ